jgi:gamma-glutamyltranspeptidase/glutathione hydrolase
MPPALHQLFSSLRSIITILMGGEPIHKSIFTPHLARIALLLLAVAVACSPVKPTSTAAPTISPMPTSSLEPFSQLNPRAAASTSAQNGMVVGTMAPEAVQAGVMVLKEGGSAVDAALTTALAQVPLMPGNFISYAGIMELLYYDAETGQVYSMNAVWDVPSAETDPLSIPFTGYPYNGTSSPSGRTALVPGFMAGLQSAHARFGTLPFSRLFEPAIAFARQGIVIDELQAGFFAQFEPVITRLPETAALFTRDDGQLYQAGDLYKQSLMADVLEQVARNGAAYMYTGAWGQQFVETIQREGGVITIEDMAAYQPIWTEPVSTSYAGHEIYAPGLPGVGGVNLVEAFNLIEAADLGRYGHFSEIPESMFWMMQIGRASVLSYLDSEQREMLFPGMDLSLESRLDKGTSAVLWEYIKSGESPLFASLGGAVESHSAAVVAVDSHGNITALTHTSNAYLYGGSGISVEGIYIPDPASYQQNLIQEAGAGNRLPNIINLVIVLRDGQPVWASACIGNVHYETLQRLASVLTYGMDLIEAQEAPTLLAPVTEGLDRLPIVQVFEGDFDRDVIQTVRELGQPVEEIPLDFDSYVLNRGILVGITIDPQSGRLYGAVPAVFGGSVGGY